MAKTIYVNCPFCEGMMEVDQESGEVLQKWEKGADAEGQDKMSSALKKLEDAKKRRKDLFSLKKGELEGQRKKLSSDFQKEVDRIKKEGGPKKPFRPIDLD